MDMQSGPSGRGPQDSRAGSKGRVERLSLSLSQSPSQERRPLLDTVPDTDYSALRRGSTALPGPTDTAAGARDVPPPTDHTDHRQNFVDFLCEKFPCSPCFKAWQSSLAQDASPQAASADPESAIRVGKQPSSSVIMRPGAGRELPERRATTPVPLQGSDRQIPERAFTTGEAFATRGDLGLHESANPDQSKHPVRSLDLSNRPQETHYSTRDTRIRKLADSIDEIVEKDYIPFFVEYEKKYGEQIKAMMKNINGIRDIVTNQAIPDINIKTNMEKKEMIEIKEMSWMDGVLDYPISSKIEHFKGIIGKYEYECSQSEITDEEREELGRKSKLVGKYIDYLNLLQEQLQKRCKKLDELITEHKKKRRELSTLKRQSGRHNEDLQNFRDGLSLANDIRSLLWNRATERYKVEYSDAVSKWVLDGSIKPVEQINKLETTLDQKIAKMQELQKRAEEDLGRHKENDNDFYFLKSQKHETDYYSKHEDLVCLQQGAWGGECGIICTQMVAAGHNKDYSEKWDKVEKMLQSFEHFDPESIRSTLSILYPMVLKQIGHPVEYQFCGDMLPFRQEYLSYMGHEPHSITADQLRDVIEGGKGPIMVGVTRWRDDKDRLSTLVRRGHSILIDAMETRDGEEHILYRDPFFGKGFCVSWKDFLEVWDRGACIPVRE